MTSLFVIHILEELPDHIKEGYHFLSPVQEHASSRSVIKIQQKTETVYIMCNTNVVPSIKTSDTKQNAVFRVFSTKSLVQKKGQCFVH